MNDKQPTGEVCTPKTIHIGPFRFVAEVCRGHYQRRYQGNTSHLIMDSILVLATLILAGALLNMLFFSRSPVMNLVSLELRTIPEELVNGARGTYNITYLNTTNESFEDVTIALRFPHGLRDIQIVPADFSFATQSITVGDLPGGGRGSITVSGTLVGTVGTHERLLAVVTYTDRFGRTRQEYSTLELPIAHSALSLETQLPEKITAGSPFPFKVRVKNDLLTDIQHMKLSFVGEGFEVWDDRGMRLSPTTISIAPTSGTEEVYMFTGLIRAREEKIIPISAVVTGIFDGEQYELARTIITSPITFSNLALRIIESVDSPKFIAPGGEARIRVYYRNNEPFPLQHVRIGLEVSGDYFEQPDSHEGNVLWHETIPLLAPGADGSITMTIRARSTVEFTRDEHDQALMLTARAQYDEGAEGRHIEIAGATVPLPVQSSVSVHTAGLFYSNYGDQVGVGPLPPQVGEYTSYFAVVRITNTTNPIGGAVLRAEIPTWAQFTHRDSATTGTHVRFDGRFLEWTIGTIPAFAGIFTPAPEFRAEISITPTNQWVGRVVPLLTNIVLTGIDQGTNTPIAITGAPISTEIFSDEKLNRVVH